MTITYRIDKGAPLTINELDDNFHDLDDRVTNIEDNPPEARSIEEITQLGNSLMVEYTDSTSDGPFTLPSVSLNFRGDWEAETPYLLNDIVKANGNVYLVLINHTSELTFDEGANNGEGQDFYGKLLDMPELSIPPAGGEDYILGKVSDEDFDTQWVNSAVRRGGSAGQVLTKVTTEDFDYEWRAPTTLSPASVAVSTSTFLPDVDNANVYHRCVHPDGCLVTIPSGVFDLDTEMVFRQCQPGAVVSLIEGPGVVLNGIFGFDNETATTGAIIHCKLVALTDASDESDAVEEWDVWGLLAVASGSDSV